MFHLLVLVLLIGIVDSLNPATVAPALYLAGGRAAHRSLPGFIAGVFAVNLAGGILLALGPGQAIFALIPRPGIELRHLLELCLGLATFAVAVALWFARARLERRVSGTEARIDRSSLLVGAGITAAELPTAVPYFAVIAAVVGSGRALSTQLGLLLLFNLAFVAPLLAILLVRALARERGREMIEQLRLRVDRYLPVAIPALVLLVAVLLTAAGTVGILTD